MSIVAENQSAETCTDISHEFEGVRFTPHSLEFRDVFETEAVDLEYTVQNVSAKPAILRIFEPKSLGFKMTAISRGHLLSPGMKITRKITYLNLPQAVTTSSLAVWVNNKSWNYPIRVLKAVARLTLNPPDLNFGVVDMGTSAMIRYFDLANEGALPTKFSFDLGANDLELVVVPLKGYIRAHSSIQIRVEFFGLKPGLFYREFWLRAINHRPTRILVKVRVNLPHLEIFHPNKTENFTLVDFPPTYYNTKRLESLILKNVSANNTNFVVLAENDKVMSVIGEMSEKIPSFNMFQVMPQEGIMTSYENKVFTIEFKPKLKHVPTRKWKNSLDSENEDDFLVFVCILRTLCMHISEIEKTVANYLKPSDQTFVDIDSSGLITSFDNIENFRESTVRRDSHDEDPLLKPPETTQTTVSSVVRLCLHGIATIPNVTLTPTEFNLGDVEPGCCIQRVLTLRNKCSSLPVHYVYRKTVSVKIIPERGKLQALQSLEVALSFTPSSLGEVKKFVKIDLLGKTDPYLGESTLSVVGHRRFLVTFNAVALPAKPKIKFNMGITPMVTNEVGILTDEVTFEMPISKPRAAMLRADLSKKRSWIKPLKPCQPLSKLDDKLPDVAKLFRRESQLRYRKDLEGNDDSTSKTSSNMKLSPLKNVSTGNSALLRQMHYEAEKDKDGNTHTTEKGEVHEIKIKGKETDDTEGKIVNKNKDKDMEETKTKTIISDKDIQSKTNTKEGYSKNSGKKSQELNISTKQEISKRPLHSLSEPKFKSQKLNFKRLTHKSDPCISKYETRAYTELQNYAGTSTTNQLIETNGNKAESEKETDSQVSYIMRPNMSWKLHSKDSTILKPPSINFSTNSNNSLNSNINTKEEKIHSFERSLTPLSSKNAIFNVDSKNELAYSYMEKILTNFLTLYEESKFKKSEFLSKQVNETITKLPEIVFPTNVLGGKNTYEQRDVFFTELKRTTSIYKIEDTIESQRRKILSMQRENEGNILSTYLVGNNTTSNTTRMATVDKFNGNEIKNMHPNSLTLTNEIEESYNSHIASKYDQSKLLDKKQTSIGKFAREYLENALIAAVISREKEKASLHKFSQKYLEKALATAMSLRENQKETITEFSRNFFDEVVIAAEILEGKEMQDSSNEKVESNPRINKKSALIAFPNDRPRSTRRWSSDKESRTIFSGNLRYSCPVDSDYTYSPQELEAKRNNDEKYLKYMRQMGANLKGLLVVKANKVTEKEYPVSETSLCQRFNLNLQEETTTLTLKQIRGTTTKTSGHLVPLNPIQLYNIKVEPYAIEFGKVAPESSSSEIMTIENQNTFPVKVVILPGRTGVRLPEGDRKIVQPQKTWQLKMNFYAENLGRYNGFMQFVINGHYTFEVTVSAEVVRKALYLTQSRLEFGTTAVNTVPQPTIMSVGLINKLQAYTRFFWEIPETSTFSALPLTGVVPPLSTLLCSVRNIPNANKTHSAELTLTSDGSISRQQLKCSYILNKPTNVRFLTNTLTIKDVPLNLLTYYTFVLFNGNYSDFIFKVLEPTPMAGCTVVPNSGTLKARSCLIFQLECKIQAVVNFLFVIRVQVQKLNILELKVTGNVAFPMVLIKPDVLRLRRISADSFDSIQLRAENYGSSMAKLKFLLNDFPEYSISESADILDLMRMREEYIIEPGKLKFLYLHFRPSDVATYVFALPLLINDILGPAVLDDTDTHYTQYYLKTNDLYFSTSITPLKVPAHIPVIRIDCTVASHILSISKHRLTFSYVPGGNKEFTKTADSIRITNAVNHEVTFCIFIDVLACTNCPFKIHTESVVNITIKTDSLEVTLPPNCSVIIHIIFSPDKPGKYSVKLPIYVEGYDALYNVLYFEGIYPPPSLVTNAKEVIFPPLPLSIESLANLDLVASHYKHSAKIRARIRPVEINGKCASDTLSVSFSQGNVIQSKKSSFKVPVQIVFRSDIPISFKTEIVFSDNRDSECSVVVIATADNCILSTYAFLKITSPTYLVTNTQSHDFVPEEKYFSELSFISKDRDSLVTSSNYSLSEDDETYIQQNLRRRISMSSARISHPIHYSSLSLFEDSSSTLVEEYGSYLSTTLNVCQEEEDVKPMRNGLGFPTFPCSSTLTVIGEFMLHTLEAVEYWLYEHAFQCMYAPSIPDGMTIMFSGAVDATRKRVQKNCSFKVKTILDILENLAGPKALKEFDTSAIPTDPVEKVKHVHNMYKQVKKFLVMRGACLAHVDAKFLLSYDDYVIYMVRVCPHKTVTPENVEVTTNIPMTIGEFKYHGIETIQQTDSDQIICSHEFERKAKYSWMDVILQIHKTLVLSKITLGTTAPSSSIMQASSSNITLLATLLEPKASVMRKDSGDEDPFRSNVYSIPECILLEWLNTHFKFQFNNLQQMKIESESKLGTTQQQEPHEVSNFDSDLADGLVFAAVTVSYCPYLVDQFFTTLFTKPETEAQVFHNAINVTMAWQTIKLGFNIRPEDIVKPNIVKMLLLTTYLYETLPSYVPKHTIRFNATLNTKEFRNIVVKNPSDRKVTYGIQFLNDPQGFFKITKPISTISISAHESANITVSYNARKICKSTAVLLMCGSVSPPTYARNITFDLVGDSKHLKVSETFKLHIPLYIDSYRKLTITPPFKTRAEYDIYISEKEPTSSDEFEATPWRDIFESKIPRRLYLNSDKLKTRGDAPVELGTGLICLTTEMTSYWLTFKDKNVGDFIIQLVIIPRTTDEIATIQVPLPPESNNNNCKWETLKQSNFDVDNGCSFLTTIPLPCRNFQLRTGMFTLLGKVVDVKEYQFWQKHLETNIGLRLARILLETKNSKYHADLVHLFNISVTYNITCSNLKMVLLPSQIEIPDIRDFNTIPLPVLVSPTVKDGFTTTLLLTSVDEKEIRNYKLQFMKPINNKSEKNTIPTET